MSEMNEEPIVEQPVNPEYEELLRQSQAPLSSLPPVPDILKPEEE